MALERLAELYLAGDVDRVFYDRRKAELTQPAAPAEVNAGLVAALGSAQWGEAALGMSPAQLRNVARALYGRIVVRGHRVAEYGALDWCKGWA